MPPSHPLSLPGRWTTDGCSIVRQGSLPGSCLRKAGELAGYTPGKAAFSLQGDTLTVFLRDRFLARPVSMKSAPTAALLQFDPLPELDYILRCAQSLTAKK